jgi:hypothetical protein
LQPLKRLATSISRRAALGLSLRGSFERFISEINLPLVAGANVISHWEGSCFQTLSKPLLEDLKIWDLYGERN